MRCQNGHIVSGDYCHVCDPLPEKKKRKRISQQSEKMKAALKVYYELRKIFLAKNPLCGFEGCTKHSFDIHHMQGRGYNLNKVETWLAICREHHTEVENHPEMAKQEGYSISRLT